LKEEYRYRDTGQDRCVNLLLIFNSIFSLIRDMATNQTFGQRIRELRKAKNLAQLSVRLKTTRYPLHRPWPSRLRRRVLWLAPIRWGRTMVCGWGRMRRPGASSPLQPRRTMGRRPGHVASNAQRLDSMAPRPARMTRP